MLHTPSQMLHAVAKLERDVVKAVGTGSTSVAARGPMGVCPSHLSSENGISQLDSDIAYELWEST